MTPTQVFSCDYCKIIKNSFSYRTPPVATFGSRRTSKNNSHEILKFKHDTQRRKEIKEEAPSQKVFTSKKLPR